MTNLRLSLTNLPMAATPSIVWFRNDLRLADNPALSAAIKSEKPVIPLYIWSPEDEAPWAPGAASRWWLHHSLESLGHDLQAGGANLIIRSGPAARVLEELIDESGASSVFWNRRYEPAVVERDEAIKAALRNSQIEVSSRNGSLLLEPGQIKTQSGTPYKVFTPFWKQFRSLLEIKPPLPAPEKINSFDGSIDSLDLSDLSLLPEIDWSDGIAARWKPGEQAASDSLTDFVENSLPDYPDTRDFPAANGTSRVSPYLHFGELSPRQIFFRLSMLEGSAAPQASIDAYLRQLGWREFSYHLLFHFPQTDTQPLYDKFEAFQWRTDDAALKRWQNGKTGYPLVDAGMRQLWATGWMHNRVRMAVASFLIKDLMIHWIEGARWFWDTLVDADLANNTMGWQWTAGTGADASPFFRVFNPVTQSKKFDPGGAYIREWIPELRDAPDKDIHEPWKLDKLQRESFTVNGTVYPDRIVNHAYARDRALEEYNRIK